MARKVALLLATRPLPPAGGTGAGTGTTGTGLLPSRPLLPNVDSDGRLRVQHSDER
jgi:hypothetical protein